MLKSTGISKPLRRILCPCSPVEADNHLTYNQKMISQETKADIRKYRKNMEIGGITLIAMGVWSVLRFIITFLLGSQNIVDLLGTSYEDFERYKWVYIAAVVLIYTVFFMIYYRIGINAVRYARGKSVKRHLVLPVLLLIITLLCIPLYFEEGISIENIDTMIASLAIDLTTVFIIFDLIYSSGRLNKIRKETDVNIAEI